MSSHLKDLRSLILANLFSTISQILNCAICHTSKPEELDWPDWQRLTYGKDCHIVLVLIPTKGGLYGDDECIFARSDEKLG
jgi:hypothetical protein